MRLPCSTSRVERRSACRVGTEASRFRRECSRTIGCSSRRFQRGLSPLRIAWNRLWGLSPDPAAEVDAALDNFEAVTEAAGLTLAHVVFVNPYLTSSIPSNVMNERYAKRFEFGNTPARATISVSALPEGHIVYTGVAVRDLSKRKAIRPKNMAPSPTASPCVFAG